MRGKLAGQRLAVAVHSNKQRFAAAGVVVLAQSIPALTIAFVLLVPAVVAAAERDDPVHRSFVPPDVAQRMALPSSPATDAAVLREQALIERAQRDAGAAAEVRRRAEELSRRFVAGDAAGDRPGDPGQPGETDTSPVATLTPPATEAPLRAPPLPQRVLTPVAVPAVATATTPVAASGADPLAAERRRAEAAEALAKSERAARLAAEAQSRVLLDRATEAMAKAQRDARAAVRRAAEAESRAAKAATASTSQSAAKTKTAAPIPLQAGAGGEATSKAAAGGNTGASGLGFSFGNALGLR